ncbi:MAG: M24 family metallopeptidase [Bryobacteraceae bacterium]
MLTEQGCGARRRRLQEEMSRRGWDVFITGNYRTAYYLGGKLLGAEQPLAFVLWQDGAWTMLQPETYSIRRAIETPFHDLVPQLENELSRNPEARRAVEMSSTPAVIANAVGPAADATMAIIRMRKRKEPDEVDEIRFSLKLAATAYRTAKATIAPGLTEVDVYNAMDAAIAREAGTAVPFPGDFACGERCIKHGGPPTNRVLAKGDLYILDLFPAPAIYFGDVCRAYTVGPATDLQMRAWEAVCKALALGESIVAPGVKARDVYARVKAYLDSHDFAENSFWHHAGHGIGHHGHEAPRIIPGCDDVFEIGDVFTLEPGIYSQALQGGIRLENNYLITERGVENLFNFPLDM